MLSFSEIVLIRQSFERIAPQSETVAENFYRLLFSMQPALRLLFSENLDQQKRKLMEMLAAAIEMLDAPGRLVPILQDLGQRHALYGVRDQHYAPVGAALLQTLRATLADAFDAETEEAWTKMYAFVAETMQSGALELSLAPDAAFGV